MGLDPLFGAARAGAGLARAGRRGTHLRRDRGEGAASGSLETANGGISATAGGSASSAVGSLDGSASGSLDGFASAGACAGDATAVPDSVPLGGSRINSETNITSAKAIRHLITAKYFDGCRPGPD